MHCSLFTIHFSLFTSDSAITFGVIEITLGLFEITLGLSGILRGSFSNPFAKLHSRTMAFPHYWTLWDKIPHYWTLFIVDADAIVVCYPLHDDGRQSFARPHAHSAKLVLVTTKITVKRLSVNPGPIGQFLSCHCFHTSSFFLARMATDGHCFYALKFNF